MMCQVRADLLSLKCVPRETLGRSYMLISLLASVLFAG